MNVEDSSVVMIWKIEWVYEWYNEKYNYVTSQKQIFLWLFNLFIAWWFDWLFHSSFKPLKISNLLFIPTLYTFYYILHTIWNSFHTKCQFSLSSLLYRSPPLFLSLIVPSSMLSPLFPLSFPFHPYISFPTFFFPQNQFQVSFLIHCFSHKKSLFFLFLLEPQLSFLIIFIHCVFFFSFDYFSFIPISFDTLSISIMSISDLAQSFVKFYYDTFDSNPQQLAGVYVFSLIFSYSILLSLARWLHAHFRGWRVPRYSEHHQQVCCIFYFSQFIHS